MTWLDRRQFLVRSGLTVAAAALAQLDRDRAEAAPTAAPAPEIEDWSAARAQFALSPDWIHLGGLYLASHPAPVREAIETHRRGLDDNPVHYLHEQQGRLEAARSKYADTIAQTNLLKWQQTASRKAVPEKVALVLDIPAKERSTSQRRDLWKYYREIDPGMVEFAAKLKAHQRRAAEDHADVTGELTLANGGDQDVTQTRGTNDLYLTALEDEERHVGVAALDQDLFGGD